MGVSFLGGVRSVCSCSCEPHPSISAALDEIPESLAPLSKKQRWDRLAKRIDKISAMGFPFLFCIFNIFYWTHYLRTY